jgi:acetyl esterase/lipase
MFFYKKKEVIVYLKLSFVFCLTFYMSQTFSQQITENKNTFTIYKNLPFSESEQSLTLDLYVPNELSEPVPCIIVIQGGGFMSQDGQRFRYFAEYIAKNNYVAALISYRGRPDYTYTTTIQDVKSTVRFIKAESSKYSIDPDRIGATGQSAGATLSTLLAVTGNNSVFDKKEPKNSCEIQAAVVYAGVFNFISRYTDSSQVALQPNIDIKIITNGEWIGSSFSKNNKNWKKASAINYIDKNDPPILFIHCKDDKTVPWLQSQEMFEKMKDMGIRTDTLYFEQGDHGFKLEDRDLYLSPMMSFFKKIFE